MTILQALSGYYDRMAARGEAEPPGFSREKISFAVVFDADGNVTGVDDLRDSTGKKPVATVRDVPTGPKRTVAVLPYFLWDKTAYSLGVTSGDGKRTALEHKAFRDLHARLLDDATDEGLAGLLLFLGRWTPDRFGEPPFSADMLDTNIVFRLAGDEGEDGGPRFIHQRPAALPLIEGRVGGGALGFCLVSGAEVPIARLHPSIKGVDGAQTMGAALVSFNLDAFSSWGREQGANAPTGQAAAARYGAALNRLLDRGSRNRLRIGDATVVFWADTSQSGEAAARRAEVAFGGWYAGGVSVAEDQDATEAVKVRAALEPLAAGRPVAIDGVVLLPETRMFILGLSPNAARLSVRFWLTDTLGAFASYALRHERDCRVEPSPWGTPPTINRLLVHTVAMLGKWDNIPPLLAGEVARAILSGGRYPRTLLSAAIIRLRAGDDPGTGWHAAAIRAVLVREQWFKRNDADVSEEGETPVSLDREHANIGYQLGRLFAVLELAQRSAIGRGINATIRDKYFGAASATPASIFPLIIANGQNHLSKLRKEQTGWAVVIERELEEIFGRITPGDPLTLPRSLRLEQQGEFAIGYYHQRKAKLGDGAAAPHPIDETEESANVQ